MFKTRIITSPKKTVTWERKTGHLHFDLDKKTLQMQNDTGYRETGTVHPTRHYLLFSTELTQYRNTIRPEIILHAYYTVSHAAIV